MNKRCAMAAEAYSRASGNWSAIVVTSGPGGTNAITGVVGAWLDSIPMLVVSGQVKRSDLSKNSGVRALGLQEVDIVRMVEGITKFAVTIEKPELIRYYMEKAWFLSTTDRPGPVWIDVPLDVQGAVIDPEQLVGFDVPKIISITEKTDNLFQEIYGMINQSKRPLILAGQGIQRAQARQTFNEFINQMHIPVQTTWIASDLLPFDNPLFLGKPGTFADRGSNFIIQNADLVLAIGTRLDASIIGYDQGQFAKKANLIVVDVDPKEISKLHRSVSLPVCMDAKDFLLGMVQWKGALKPQENWENWIHQCRSWRNKYPVISPEYRSPDQRVNTYYFGELLSDELDEGDQVILDGSSAAAVPILLTYKMKNSQRLICNGGLGSMGYGLPASIGAYMAHPCGKTICINGDGGFQLNAQELSTIAHYRMPIKIFVLSNYCYGSIKEMQNQHFEGRHVACDAQSGMYLPDVVALAKAYGVKSKQIKLNRDVLVGIQEVLAEDGPVLCEISVDLEQKMMPRVASKINSDGTIQSTSLEDLWPFLDSGEVDNNMKLHDYGSSERSHEK